MIQTTHPAVKKLCQPAYIMTVENELTTYIGKELAIDLPDNINMEDLIAAIAIEVNHLIDKNFQKLVGILYRMDVSEPKLKNLLANHPQADAGIIIAQLMIERQLQKIATRKQFRKNNDNVSEEDKW